MGYAQRRSPRGVPHAKRNDPSVRRAPRRLVPDRQQLENAADGHIDVEASDARLAERPATYRGGTTRGPHGGATRGPQRSLAELSELLLADAERMMAKLIGDPL